MMFGFSLFCCINFVLRHIRLSTDRTCLAPFVASFSAVSPSDSFLRCLGGGKNGGAAPPAKWQKKPDLSLGARGEKARGRAVFGFVFRLVHVER